MAQRLEFPLLKEVPADRYWQVLHALVRFIDDARPRRRDLREFMLDQGTWDREGLPRIFDLLQIEKNGKTYRSGRLARQLLDTNGVEGDLQEVMFRYLARQNPFLVKYVFEALDERLFSDAELWRYLTSYVYPGEHVGGQQLRDWLAWMQHCGILRVVGIRWALGDDIDDARKLVSRIDIEELLDDDEDEDYDDEDDDDDDDDDDRQQVVAALSPQPADEPEGAAALTPADAVGNEVPAEGPDVPDLPDTPSSSFADALEGSVAAAPSQAGAQMPERVFKPSPLSAEGVPAAEALAENLGMLRRWWSDACQGRALRRADDFGLMPLQYEMGDRRVFLLQLLSLATLVEGDPREGDRMGFVNRLNRSRFFNRVIEDPNAALAVLDELSWLADNPEHGMLAENLFEILRHRSVLCGDPELVESLLSPEDPDNLVALLRERFFGGRSSLEAHWVIREMTRLGLWSAEKLGSAAVVPHLRARETAYRLGLHETPYAGDVRGLSAASAAIAVHLGPADGYDEPLADFAEHHGCAWSCPNTSDCPYHCREKTTLP